MRVYRLEAVMEVLFLYLEVLESLVVPQAAQWPYLEVDQFLEQEEKYLY